jgi:hypothetical protein
MHRHLLFVLSELAEVDLGVLVGLLADDQRYKLFLAHAIYYI